MDWRQYEDDVADLFRQLGWTVEVHATVQGVRTRHEIDVWALSAHFGGVVRWVIECKDWNSRIPKEKVMALRAIVDDVGADRGLILNERGFQAGAYEAARSSNVILTCLTELHAAAALDLQEIELAHLHHRLVDLKLRVWNLWQHVDTNTLKSRRGMSDSRGLTAMFGVVSTTEEAVLRARVGSLPQMVWLPRSDEFIRVTTLAEAIERGQEVVESVATWVYEQETGITEAGGWEEGSA